MNRRDFLRNLGMAAVGAVLPKVKAEPTSAHLWDGSDDADSQYAQEQGWDDEGGYMSPEYGPVAYWRADGSCLVITREREALFIGGSDETTPSET